MDYFLKSKRLGFRCWSANDLALAMGLWGDPRVTAFIGGPFTPEKVRERLAREIQQMETHGVQYWPIFLLESHQHAGCAGLRPYRPEQKVYELGVHLCQACWGKGFAIEASRAAIRYGFDVLGAEALFAGHHPENAASRRLLSKLGFEHTHEELYPPTGLMHPSYLLRKG